MPRSGNMSALMGKVQCRQCIHCVTQSFQTDRWMQPISNNKRIVSSDSEMRGSISKLDPTDASPNKGRSKINRLTVMKCGRDVHGPERINLFAQTFIELLTFHVLPSSGQKCLICPKLMTSASVLN